MGEYVGEVFPVGGDIGQVAGGSRVPPPRPGDQVVRRSPGEQQVVSR